MEFNKRKKTITITIDEASRIQEFFYVWRSAMRTAYEGCESPVTAEFLEKLKEKDYEVYLEISRCDDLGEELSRILTSYRLG